MSKSVKSLSLCRLKAHHRRWIRMAALSLGFPRLEHQDYEVICRRFDDRYGWVIFIREVKAILHGKPRPRQRFRRRVTYVT